MITEVQLDADEHIILRINRTLLGLIPLYMFGVMILGGLMLSIYLIAKNQPVVAESLPVPMAILLTVLGGILLGLIDYVLIRVYLGNKMILTNERLIQMTQSSLFHQSVPQLNLADIQEVTVHQNSILSNIFNYGTIVIETAGEQKNLILKFASNPHNAVKEIDDASEVYKGTDPNPDPNLQAVQTQPPVMTPQPTSPTPAPSVPPPAVPQPPVVPPTSAPETAATPTPLVPPVPPAISPNSQPTPPISPPESDPTPPVDTPPAPPA